MAMIDLNLNPTTRQLRQFSGIWFPAFVCLVSVLVWRATNSLQISAAVLLPALAISGIGLFLPRVSRPIFVTFVIATFPIGWTVSHLVLAATYYLMITPIGLVLRMFRRDPMHREFLPKAESYWVARDQATDKQRYFRQF